MAAGDVAIVRGAYEALKARQLQKLLQLAAPDLAIEESADLPWGGRYQGFAGLQQFMIRLTQYVDASMTPDHFIDAGRQVVAVGRITGTAREGDRPFDVPAVHVWTLCGGKLSRFHAYVDHPALLDAIASPAPPESA